jgi:hypothetical protein
MMTFENLPRKWRNININLKEKRRIVDTTDLYLLNFSSENISLDTEFFIPVTEKNRFYMNGYNYVVWHRLCKPICSIEYIDNIHTVIINNILTRPDKTDNFDLKFYYNNGFICEYKDKQYDLENTYLHDIFYGYWLTNLDRSDLNMFLGSETQENYITNQDIEAIKLILKDNTDYITNWKDIYQLRVIGLEELIISVIMSSLPDVLKTFFRGEINSQLLTRNIRKFLSADAPEIHLDLSETKIAAYSQNNKVILPFNNYCDVSELVPDKHWYKYLDLLDSPQSIKVGSVASFSNNVIIENGKIKASIEEQLSE